jgi:hypothetical protein
VAGLFGIRLRPGPNSSLASLVPSAEDISRQREFARETVVATEAFRRFLIAELENVERYLNADTSGGMASRTFDPRDPKRVSEYLRGSWEVDLKLSSRSPDFKVQADWIARTLGSLLEVTEANCNAAASGLDFSCALSGRVVFRGVGLGQSPVTGRSMVESLKMASFTSEFGTGGGKIRFAIPAAEAGGNMEFSGTLSAATGRMQDGTVTWSSSRGSQPVGTWSATRGAR